MREHHEKLFFICQVIVEILVKVNYVKQANKSFHQQLEFNSDFSRKK